jgi:hypothetical protein
MLSKTRFLWYETTTQGTKQMCKYERECCLLVLDSVETIALRIEFVFEKRYEKKF